jgi:zinc-finger-containing domain
MQELPEMPPIECNFCDDVLVLVHNPDHKSPYPYAYKCRNPKCGGRTSAHPDGTPMARPTTARIRRLRHECHKVFDRLWLNIHLMPDFAHVFRKPATKKNQKERTSLRSSARKRAYLYMAHHLGLDPSEAHIGSIVDADILTKFKEIAAATTDKEVQRWWRAEGRKIFRGSGAEKKGFDKNITPAYI